VDVAISGIESRISQLFKVSSELVGKTDECAKFTTTLNLRLTAAEAEFAVSKQAVPRTLPSSIEQRVGHNHVGSMDISLSEHLPPGPNTQTPMDESTHIMADATIITTPTPSGNNHKNNDRMNIDSAGPTLKSERIEINEENGVVDLTTGIGNRGTRNEGDTGKRVDILEKEMDTGANALLEYTLNTDEVPCSYESFLTLSQALMNSTHEGGMKIIPADILERTTIENSLSFIKLELFTFADLCAVLHIHNNKREELAILPKASLRRYPKPLDSLWHRLVGAMFQTKGTDGRPERIILIGRSSTNGHGQHDLLPCLRQQPDDSPIHNGIKHLIPSEVSASDSCFSGHSGTNTREFMLKWRRTYPDYISSRTRPKDVMGALSVSIPMCTFHNNETSDDIRTAIIQKKALLNDVLESKLDSLASEFRPTIA